MNWNWIEVSSYTKEKANMVDKVKTDATKKLMGPNYQYVIALECCLNAKEDETIYIEQRGDVVNSQFSFEVKHHYEEDHVLNERHIDFWKTLSNWVKDFKIFSGYDYLILLTTSTVKEDTIFDKWNGLSKEEKLIGLKKIIQEKITETIRPFVETIFSYNDHYNEKDLLEVLDKARIRYNQKRIQEKIEELEKHNAFRGTPKKNRQHFIYNLLGNAILRNGIENPESWEIYIGDFNNEFISQAKHYCSEEIPLPKPNSPVTNADVKPYQDRPFVRELRKIYDEDEEDEEDIRDAINDYHRANQTVALLCGVNGNINVDFAGSIGEYQKKLLKDLRDEKKYHELDLALDCQLNQRKKKSRQCYIKCKQWSLKKISGISQNEDFFQRGIIHQIVEDGKHIWLIERKI